MGLRFYFNAKAMESLAKELRRASWGLSTASAAGWLKYDSFLLVSAGVIAWILLQIFAAVLESVKEKANEGDSK